MLANLHRFNMNFFKYVNGSDVQNYTRYRCNIMESGGGLTGFPIFPLPIRGCAPDLCVSRTNICLLVIALLTIEARESFSFGRGRHRHVLLLLPPVYVPNCKNAWLTQLIAGLHTYAAVYNAHVSGPGIGRSWVDIVMYLLTNFCHGFTILQLLARRALYYAQTSVVCHHVSSSTPSEVGLF